MRRVDDDLAHAVPGSDEVGGDGPDEGSLPVCGDFVARFQDGDKGEGPKDEVDCGLEEEASGVEKAAAPPLTSPGLAGGPAT